MCDDGQHQNVSLGITRHNLGWAKGQTLGKNKKQAILLYWLQVCTHIMLWELTSVHVNHDITINLTEMMENVFLKDNYVMNMFGMLICSRVRTTPKSDSSNIII